MPLIRKICGVPPALHGEHRKRVTQELSDASLLHVDDVSYAEKAVHVVGGIPTLVTPGHAAFDEGVSLDESGNWLAVAMDPDDCTVWEADTEGLL